MKNYVGVYERGWQSWRGGYRTKLGVLILETRKEVLSFVMQSKTIASRAVNLFTAPAKRHDAEKEKERERERERERDIRLDIPADIISAGDVFCADAFIPRGPK